MNMYLKMKRRFLLRKINARIRRLMEMDKRHRWIMEKANGSPDPIDSMLACMVACYFNPRPQILALLRRRRFMIKSLGL